MSNATSNFSSSLSEDPDSHRTNFPRTSLVIILGVLSFGTVVGNSIVCFAIRSHPALRHVTYLSIFSLAIADLLVGFVAMPSYILKKFDWHEPLQTIICDVFRSSYFLTSYASVLSVSLISVERLIAIRKPLDHVTIVTRGRVVMALFVAWFDALIVSSLPFVPWDSNHPYKECNYEPTRWWSIMVIICNVTIPFLVIVVCYSHMYLTAKSHIKKMANDKKSLRNNKGRASAYKERKERRGNITLMIVIGVFVACWFPSSFYYLLQKTCRQCFPPSFQTKQTFVNAFVKLLTFASSFINPLIYSWRSREFRSVFLTICLRKKKRLFNSTTQCFSKYTSRRNTDQGCKTAVVQTPDASKLLNAQEAEQEIFAESAA